MKREVVLFSNDFLFSGHERPEEADEKMFGIQFLYIYEIEKRSC